MRTQRVSLKYLYTYTGVHIDVLNIQKKKLNTIFVIKKNNEKGQEGECMYMYPEIKFVLLLSSSIE